MTHTISIRWSNEHLRAARESNSTKDRQPAPTSGPEDALMPRGADFGLPIGRMHVCDERFQQGHTVVRSVHVGRLIQHPEPHEHWPQRWAGRRVARRSMTSMS